MSNPVNDNINMKLTEQDKHRFVAKNRSMPASRKKKQLIHITVRAKKRSWESK